MPRELKTLPSLVLLLLQYIASCLDKKVQPRFSLKQYDDLRPKEKEEFIRPVHAGPQQDVPTLYSELHSELACLAPHCLSPTRNTNQSHF